MRSVPTGTLASRLTRIDDSQGGFLQWVYDDASRIVNERTSNGVVTYSYNNANQIASMAAADRSPVTYGYDPAGRLQTITQNSEIFTYGYDVLSRVTSLARPNGVTSAYSYDVMNNLTRLTHSRDGNAIEDFSYTYNLDDELQSVTSLASATLLAEAKNAGTANAANRIAQVGTDSFTFDDLGQTTSKQNTGGTTSYEWDARGRLTRANLADNQSVAYGHDPLGRLASRTSAGATTTFLYDGWDVVQDRTGSNTVDYLNGMGVDWKLRQASATGAQYFLEDHLGSTIALTDPSGNVVERNQYEAFGNTAGSSLTRYGFTGRERDPLTALMHYRARWYDPAQGRFITEDPIGMAGGMNLYGYVQNSPTNLVDPFGYGGRGGRGATNPLRDPASPENWEANAASNTLSDYLDLDTVAEAGYAVGDPCLDWVGRVAAGAYLAARVAENFFGLVGRGAKAAGRGLGLLERTAEGGGARALSGEVRAVESAVQAESRGVKAAEKALDEGANAPKDVTKRPSNFRKGTVQDAWQDAAEGSKPGTKACPTCAKDVEVAPGQGRRDWDVDHQPKWKDRDLSGMDRKQVLDEYNKSTRLRCPSCNRADH